MLFLVAKEKKLLFCEIILTRGFIYLPVKKQFYIHVFSCQQLSPVWAKASCGNNDLSSPHSPWDVLTVTGKRAKSLDARARAATREPTGELRFKLRACIFRILGAKCKYEPLLYESISVETVTLLCVCSFSSP